MLMLTSETDQRRIKNLEKKLQEAGFDIKYRRKDELKLHRCPLHKDRTPSLTVNTKTGRFRCFSCNWGGSVSKLLREYGIEWGGNYQAPEIDELEKLFRECLAEKSEEKSAEETATDYKADINELKKYKYYHPYLESRGFSKEFILANKIGFDKKSLRVMIPIFLFGTYYGCIQRSVVSDTPKVRYADDMPKEKVVYWPLTARNKGETLTVTEGFADSLRFSSFGYDSVSILGCQCSQTQLELIYKIANGRQIIWALDNDPPGQEGTLKILNMVSPIDNSKIFNYNGMEVKDPGEISTKEEMDMGIENAMTILEYYQ